MKPTTLIVAAAALLAAVGFQAAKVDAAKRNQTIANAKMLSVAMLMYVTDNDDVSVCSSDPEVYREPLRPYVKSLNAFQTLNPAGGAFLLNKSTVRVDVSGIKEPAKTPMFYESKSWADGGRVSSFWDGHVKVMTSAAWAKAQPYLKLKIKQVK